MDVIMKKTILECSNWTELKKVHRYGRFSLCVRGNAVVLNIVQVCNS